MERIDEILTVVFQHTQAVQLFIAIFLILFAIHLVEDGLNKIFWIVLGIGVYLFSRGIITIAMIQGWIIQIPDLIRYVFLIFT